MTEAEREIICLSETSVTLSLDHGVMGHLHAASVGPTASVQRSRHAVAELEVSVRHVRA